MRIFRSTTSDQNANTYIGPFGEIVVSDNGTLLIQNNVTPGGSIVTVEPATPTVLGGVKLGDGFVLNSSNQVTTSMLYSTNLTQPTQHYRLQLDTNGIVILPDQSIINGSTLRAVAGSYAGLTTNDGENSWMWVDTDGAHIATEYNNAANNWTFDNNGNLTLPAGGTINFANGSNALTGGGGAANLGDFSFNSNNMLMPLQARLNSGGVGNTNAAEFGTVVNAFDNGIVNTSNIYMSAGTGEARIMVNANGAGLTYFGVENPGFAGMVSMDPGVKSQYAIGLDANSNIIIGATQTGGTLTAPLYTAGIGAINESSTINGLYADSTSTAISGIANVKLQSGGGEVWTFDNTGNLILPAGGNISPVSGYMTLGDGLLVGAGGSLFNANNETWALYGQTSDPGTVIELPGLSDSQGGRPLLIRHDYAAVNVQSAGGTWSFGADGTTAFPNNSLLAPTGNPLEIKAINGNVYALVDVYDTYASIGIQDNDTGANPAWAYFETDMPNVNTPSATVIIKPGDTGTEVRWTFGADGNLTVPSNSVIATVSNNLGISTQLYPTFTAPNQTEDGGPVISVLISQYAGSVDVDPTWSANIAGNVYAVVSSVTNGSYQEITLNSGSFAYDVQVTFTPQVNTWAFDQNGGTTFPDGTYAAGDLEGTGDFGFEMPADVGFTILSNVGIYQWTFDAAGGLTFPDATVQTTAYTGAATATGYALTVGDINTDNTHFDVVTVDTAGSTYYLGHTTGLTPGDSPFIIKVNSSGRVQWQTTLEFGGVITSAYVFLPQLGLTVSDSDSPSRTWTITLNTDTGALTYSYYFITTVETIKIRDSVLGFSGGAPAWESQVGYYNSGTGVNSGLAIFFSYGPSYSLAIAEDGAAGAVEYYGTATNPTTANVYAVGNSVTYGSVVSLYNPVGDVQWHKNINLTQDPICATSVAYNNGNIYVVSNNTSNGNDGFVTKMDAISGAMIWQVGMGSGLSGNTEPFGISDGSITIDGNGDIITAWNYGSAFSQNSDILVVKFDPNGNNLWQRSIGTAGGDYYNSNNSTEFVTADAYHYYIAITAKDTDVYSVGGALQFPLDGSGLGTYGTWLYSQQSWTVYPQDITGGSVDITSNLIATSVTLNNSSEQGVTITQATLPTTLNLIGGGITTGDITFDATTLIGPDGPVDGYKIFIQPSGTFENTVAFYPTGDGDIHIFEDSALKGGITLGDYGKSTISVWSNGGTNPIVDDIALSAINNGNITLRTDANVTPNQWIFRTDGATIFPTLSVNLHNGGTQNGSVLQFGDPNQQSIITGPPPAQPGYNAQRLIVQGQNGGTGEGGDVYFWAGDADTNGGDIKIYAGDADNVTTGNGGYINIDAGNGHDSGGDLTLRAGYSTLNGGDVTINGGYAYGGTHGRIQLTTANSYNWVFDATGNLVLPNNGTIFENTTTIPGSGSVNNIVLKPYGGSDPNQRLVIYPTAVEGNHIHLTSGNLLVTDIFLGDDAQFIKTNTDGSMAIGTNVGPGGSGGNVWTFGTDGNLTLPLGGEIFSAAGTGNVVINANDGTLRTWTFEGSGNLTLPTSGTISYAPSTPGDWTSPAPTSIEAALDRLAAVVKVLNGGTGA